MRQALPQSTIVSDYCSKELHSPKKQLHRVRHWKFWCSVRAALQHSSSDVSQHSSDGELPIIIRAPSPVTGSLQAAASAVSGLPLDEVSRLIHLGAVYYGDPDLPLVPKKDGLGPRWRRARDLRHEALEHPIQQVSHIYFRHDLPNIE